MCCTTVALYRQGRIASCWSKRACIAPCGRPRPRRGTARCTLLEQSWSAMGAIAMALRPCQEAAMRHDLVRELADVTEFRLAIQARPPGIAHGTLLLLTALLGAALVWLAVTPADLVVRAPGRVRPVTSPIKVVSGGGEGASTSSGGRVV